MEPLTGTTTTANLTGVVVTFRAVVNLLVVVILDLHHFVAGGKSPAEPLDFALAGGIESRLQFDIKRPRTNTAATARD